MRIVGLFRKFSITTFLMLLIVPLMVFGVNLAMLHEGLRSPDLIDYGKSSITNLDYHAVLNDDNSMTVKETWHLAFKDRGSAWHGVYKDFSLIGSSTITGFKVYDNTEKLWMSTSASESGSSDANRRTAHEKMFFHDGFRQGNKTITLQYTITSFTSAINDATLINWMPIDSTNTLPVRHINGDITWRKESRYTADNWIRTTTEQGYASSKAHRNKLTFTVDSLPSSASVLVMGLAPRDITTSEPMTTLNAATVKSRNADHEKRHFMMGVIAIWLALLVIVPLLSGLGKHDEDTYFRDVPKVSPGIASKIALMLGWSHKNTYAEALLLSCVNKKAIIFDEEGIMHLDQSKAASLASDEEAFFHIVSQATRDFENVTTSCIMHLDQSKAASLTSDGEAFFDTLSQATRNSENVTMSSLPDVVKTYSQDRERAKLNTTLTRQANDYIKGRGLITICRILVCIMMFMSIGLLLKNAYLDASGVYQMIPFVVIFALFVLSSWTVSAGRKPIRTILVYASLAVMFILGFSITPMSGIIIGVLMTVASCRLSPYAAEGHADDVQELRGLYAYMNDFSDFSKRGVPDVTLWEWYMAYAAAFGIADEVSRKLRNVFNQLPESQQRYYRSSALAMYGICHEGDRYHDDMGTSWSPGSMDALNTSFTPSSGGSGGSSGGGGSSSSGSSGGGGMGAF